MIFLEPTTRSGENRGLAVVSVRPHRCRSHPQQQRPTVHRPTLCYRRPCYTCMCTRTSASRALPSLTRRPSFCIPYSLQFFFLTSHTLPPAPPHPHLPPHLTPPTLAPRHQRHFIILAGRLFPLPPPPLLCAHCSLPTTATPISLPDNTVLYLPSHNIHAPASHAAVHSGAFSSLLAEVSEQRERAQPHRSCSRPL